MSLPHSLKRDLLAWLPTVTIRAAANLPAGTNEAIFTIADGWVEVLALWGEVTTVIQTQLNNTKLTYDPTDTGASTDLCAVLDISADAVGTIYTISDNVASALDESGGLHFLDSGAGLTKPLRLKPGSILLDCSATNTGQIKWFCYWRPLEVAGVVAAA